MLLVSVQVQAAKPELEVVNNIVNNIVNKNVKKIVKPPPYTSSLFQSGQVYIGGQPGYNDFKLLKKAGFSRVINMRTPEEMKELKFYEDYLLKKAGIGYDFIPIDGKDNEYSPEKLAEFAQALDSAGDGKVLLHCQSGHRASQLWAAYLVKYKGHTPDEALAKISDMGWWPMPMESLLNKKLHVTIAE